MKSNVFPTSFQYLKKMLKSIGKRCERKFDLNFPLANNWGIENFRRNVFLNWLLLKSALFTFRKHVFEKTVPENT